jgi:hypothetical protein
MGPLNRSRLWLVFLAAVLSAAVFLLIVRSNNGGLGKATTQGKASKANLTNLGLLEPHQLLASVGEVELRSEDLREVLQKQFQGRVSHAGLSPQDLASQIGRALDTLIENELLAQAGKRQGLKTNLSGHSGRQDLARQYLQRRVATLPRLSDADLRSFYRNHGEKFYVPPSAQVRQLFLPLQGTGATPRKSQHEPKDRAYVLAEQLAARIRNGESVEALAQQFVPEAYRNRAQVQRLDGSIMSIEDEQKVLALRPGEVAGPLRVEGGYSVFQGIAQIRSGMIPFYEAKEKIRSYLEAKKVDEARKQLVAELRQQTGIKRFGAEPAVASFR